MKKLLLSSIIMFGICGYVTAQNATGSKLGKTTTTTSSATLTPQKSAVATDVAPAATTTTSDVAPASDKVNAPAAVAPTVKRVSKTEAATAVAADGTVIPTNDLQKKEAARQAAPAKKNN